MTKENILRQAEKLVYGDREKSYGNPFDDFKRTAQMWTGIIGHPIRPQHVALCMIAVKISRECNKPKRDNWVDIAGYAATIEKMYDEIKKSLSDGALDEGYRQGLFE